MNDIWRDQMFEGLFSVSPILQQIATPTQREGDEHSFMDEQGNIRMIEYKPTRVEFSHKVEPAVGASVKEFLECARKPGIDMGKAMMSRLFEELEKVTEETGNVVGVKRGALTWEEFLDLIEKVEFDFTANGIPKLPSLVMGPEFQKELLEKMPKWFEDEQFRTRWQRILQKKWESFCERQANRRLVD
jgi:hypothetical protein